MGSDKELALAILLRALKSFHLEIIKKGLKVSMIRRYEGLNHLYESATRIVRDVRVGICSCE